MTGSAWTAFFTLLLVEAAAVAILVAIVMRERPALRRAGSPVDHELARGLGMAALGLALFPLYALVVVTAGRVLRAAWAHQGALETILLPMCLAITAMGIAYTGIVLIRPRRALG